MRRSPLTALRRRARRAPPSPIPPAAAAVLKLVPPEFVDDGCSWVLDGLAGISWRWACRIHDWRGCSRCHLPMYLNPDAQARANAELRRNVLASVPVGWAAIPATFWIGLTLVGGRGWYDTCGKGEHAHGASSAQREAGLCRHGMPLPEWWDRLVS